MQKYSVGAKVTISISEIVEAESEEDARQIAESLEMPGLCHCCARNEEGCWGLSEIDGEAFDIDSEEA